MYGIIIWANKKIIQQTNLETNYNKKYHDDSKVQEFFWYIKSSIENKNLNDKKSIIYCSMRIRCGLALSAESLRMKREKKR